LLVVSFYVLLVEKIAKYGKNYTKYASLATKHVCLLLTN